MFILKRCSYLSQSLNIHSGGYCSKRYVKLVNTEKFSVGVEVICSKKKKNTAK